MPQTRGKVGGGDALGGVPVGELDADLVPGVIGLCLERRVARCAVHLHGIGEILGLHAEAGRGLIQGYATEDGHDAVG
ncbi:MAG: hypothetical protein ACRDQ4_06470 [Pseudonocardiaceae bacterium]